MFDVGKEFFVFVYAGLTGMFLMLFYQFLELIRYVISHKPWMVNLEDSFFWTFTSFYLFYQIYRTTNGSIRWFFIVGTFLGAGIIWDVCFCGRRYVRNKKNLEKKNKKR